MNKCICKNKKQCYCLSKNDHIKNLIHEMYDFERYNYPITDITYHYKHGKYTVEGVNINPDNDRDQIRGYKLKFTLDIETENYQESVFTNIENLIAWISKVFFDVLDNKSYEM